MSKTKNTKPQTTFTAVNYTLKGLPATIRSLWDAAAAIRERAEAAERAQRRQIFEMYRDAEAGLYKGWKTVKPSTVRVGDQIWAEDGEVHTVSRISTQNYGRERSFGWQLPDGTERFTRDYKTDSTRHGKVIIAVRPTKLPAKTKELLKVGIAVHRQMAVGSEHQR